MLEAYRQHVAERAALGIPPLPLNAKQTEQLVELLKNPPKGEEDLLVELITFRVPPGVDDAAKVKASFLAAVAHGDIQVGLISKAKATELLGTMVGGYNVHPLIELLDDAEVAGVAADGLKKTLLMFDYFNDVATKAKAGNAKAQEVMKSWADAEWFTSRPEVEKKITVTVFKVPGETNTDDLSPAPDAWSRPDIPLHYLAMLKNTRPDVPVAEVRRRSIRSASRWSWCDTPCTSSMTRSAASARSTAWSAGPALAMTSWTTRSIPLSGWRTSVLAGATALRQAH